MSIRLAPGKSDRRRETFLPSNEPLWRGVLCGELSKAGWLGEVGWASHVGEVRVAKNEGERSQSKQ
jgi:hypothetical protein